MNILGNTYKAREAGVFFLIPLALSVLTTPLWWLMPCTIILIAPIYLYFMTIVTGIMWIKIRNYD